MSKVVLITGGSSGIGKSVGEYLQTKGYTVYGTSRKPENYPDSKIKLVALDVNNYSTITKAVQEVITAENRLDILINNAGVGITGPIEETPIEQIKQNFDTNVFGPIQVIKAVLPQMRQQQSGTIINVTSIAGFMGLPYRGMYSASKSAFSIATEALRMEIKDFNIKMCTLAPGDFATDIASRRFHTPASQQSPYTKYQTILDTINEHVDDGENPILVAKMVEKIINTKNPKVHYKVGTFLQKFSIVLKAILPSKVYENMLLNHYKL